MVDRTVLLSRAREEYFFEKLGPLTGKRHSSRTPMSLKKWSIKKQGNREKQTTQLPWFMDLNALRNCIHINKVYHLLEQSMQCSIWLAVLTSCGTVRLYVNATVTVVVVNEQEHVLMIYRKGPVCKRGQSESELYGRINRSTNQNFWSISYWIKLLMGKEQTKHFCSFWKLSFFSGYKINGSAR